MHRMACRRLLMQWASADEHLCATTPPLVSGPRRKALDPLLPEGFADSDVSGLPPYPDLNSCEGDGTADGAPMMPREVSTAESSSDNAENTSQGSHIVDSMAHSLFSSEQHIVGQTVASASGIATQFSGYIAENFKGAGIVENMARALFANPTPELLFSETESEEDSPGMPRRAKVWDFPLSQDEKKLRLTQLFEVERQAAASENRALKRYIRKSNEGRRSHGSSHGDPRLSCGSFRSCGSGRRSTGSSGRKRHQHLSESRPSVGSYQSCSSSDRGGVVDQP